MVGHANLVGFYQLIPYLRHYPLRFASKVIENIPAFQHFSGRFKKHLRRMQFWETFILFSEKHWRMKRAEKVPVQGELQNPVRCLALSMNVSSAWHGPRLLPGMVQI